jgi:hypothetical protein
MEKAMVRLFESLKRFFFWGNKLKNSYDWDHHYLEEILYLKLIRMRECFNSESFHHNRWSIKEELKGKVEYREGLVLQYKADVALDICIGILKRRVNDEYGKIVGLYELSKNATYSFDDSTFNRLINGKPATVGFLLKEKEMLLSEDRLKDRDKKLLFTLMNDYIAHWWS